MSQRNRNIRILLLLVVLAIVSVRWAAVKLDEGRVVTWSGGHGILVCPLLLPGVEFPLSREKAELAEDDLEDWMIQAFEDWHTFSHRPTEFTVAPPVRIEEEPPDLPDAGAGFFERWRKTSAFLEFFDETNGTFPDAHEDATRIYLVFYPESESGKWAGRHSVGTKRGRRGIVFARADEEAWGNTLCLVLHEFLHTVGALDHREPEGYVSWPKGYAEPDLEPLHPQEFAEVMALGIPTSDTSENWVTSLDDVLMGEATAREIGWLTDAVPE